MCIADFLELYWKFWKFFEFFGMILVSFERFLTPADWGEFLFRFELGLLWLVLLKTALSWCGVGGSALFFPPASGALRPRQRCRASSSSSSKQSHPRQQDILEHIPCNQSSLLRLVTKGWARQVFVEGGWPLTTWCVHRASRDRGAQPPI